MSTAVISAVGLTKVFKDFWHRARVRAVDNLDLTVESGQICGLLGPNGSGKSTTIKMILGLLYPTRGRVTVFGRLPDDVRIKNRIGYLPEESYLYRFLDARETLDYYGKLFHLNRRERRRRTEELLEMVGLKTAARRPVGEYSKGMARRIGLAQALINDPDLLILDEPTSGLDPIGAKLVKDIILRLGREFKKTILLSSHLLADVEEVCDYVTILYGGKVQVAGPIEDVLAVRDRVVLEGQRLSEQTLREIVELVRSKEGKTLEIRTPRDRLENLFLRVVEQAHARQIETAGTTAAGQIAAFLGGEATGREVLEQLVRVEPEPPPAAPEPEPLPASEPQHDVLHELTEPVAAAESAGGSDEVPAEPEPAPEAVDTHVLEELLGGASDEDQTPDAESRDA